MGLCRKCRYDISGTVSGRCPECGTSTSQEQPIAKVRANPYVVMLGCGLIVIALHGRWVSQRRSEGAAAFVPSIVLIFAADLEDKGKTDDLREVLRGRARGMWSWQRALGKWRESRDWNQEDVTSIIQSRTVWPAGSVIGFEVVPNRTGSVVFGDRIIRIRRSGAKESEMGLYYSATFASGSGLGVPFRAVRIREGKSGKHSVQFEFDITEPDGRTFHFTHAYDYSIAEEHERVLQPVQSIDVEKMIRSVLIAEARPRQRDVVGYEVIVYADADPLRERIDSSAAMTGIASHNVVLRLEVCDGEKVVFRRVTFVGDNRYSSLDREMWKDTEFAELVVPVPHQPGFFYLPDDVLDRLTVRVRGNEAGAAETLSAHSFWDGDLRIPLRDILEQGHR